MDSCFECDAPTDERHHVIPRSQGGRRTVPLCSACHGRVHSMSRGDIRALTREGLQRARDRGVVLGRPRTIDDSVQAVIQNAVAAGASYSHIARVFNAIDFEKRYWYPASVRRMSLRSPSGRQETQH